MCPFIDLRKSKISKELKISNVVMGNLNLLGWIILKYNISTRDYLIELLAELCAITQKDYWERLVNTDSHRKILFPSIYNGDRLKNQ